VGDFDNDGWPDILTCNGHVYPEVPEKASESGYRECKVLYRNLGNGKFEDVSLNAGPGILEVVDGRGCALGDFDNDGDLDAVEDKADRGAVLVERHRDNTSVNNAFHSVIMKRGERL
jgi:VCBS repeat protein